MGLIDELVVTLNITEWQAAGGVGAILRLARDNLREEDFGCLQRAMPEMDHFVATSAAEDYMMGAFGELATQHNRQRVRRMAILGSRFSRLGLESEMIEKFFPVMSESLCRDCDEGIADIMDKILT